LSIFFITHFLGAKTVKKYVGMAESTVVISRRRPALVRKRPLHAGSLLPSLSIRGWISTRLICLK
jgi:hypothetical protein